MACRVSAACGKVCAGAAMFTAISAAVLCAGIAPKELCDTGCAVTGADWKKNKKSSV